MNQEAIELLEKANEGTTLLSDRAYYRINPDKYNKALNILKQQPAEGEFTKKFRELIKISEKHLSKNKIGRLQTYGREACKIIDRAEAEIKREQISWANENGLKEIAYQKRVELEATNKDLLIASKDALNKLNWPIYTEREKLKMKPCRERLESVISKAKKEGK